MKVSQLRLEDVSFSDCRLRKVGLYIDQGLLRIDMGELYYPKRQMYVSDISFFGWGWEQVSITSYNPESGTTQAVCAPGNLREIEWSAVDGPRISFGGFCVDSDTWIELAFTNLHYCFVRL